MNELQLSNQMDIVGGGAGTWILCIVIGTAVYKMLFSKSGRVSPKTWPCSFGTSATTPRSHPDIVRLSHASSRRLPQGCWCRDRSRRPGAYPR